MVRHVYIHLFYNRKIACSAVLTDDNTPIKTHWLGLPDREDEQTRDEYEVWGCFITQDFANIIGKPIRLIHEQDPPPPKP